MKRLIELFIPVRLLVVLLAWPSSGMATIASAFQAGSGVNVSAMRLIILTLGASLAVLFTAYVLTLLMDMNSTADESGQRMGWEHAIRIAILMALLVGVIFAL